MYLCPHHSTTAYNVNLVIRIGGEGDEIENNAICRYQIDLTVSGAALITYMQGLFGDWIRIIKSSSDVANDYLVLEEVRVLGSEYNRNVKLGQRSPQPFAC